MGTNTYILQLNLIFDILVFFLFVSQRWMCGWVDFHSRAQRNDSNFPVFDVGPEQDDRKSNEESHRDGGGAFFELLRASTADRRSYINRDKWQWPIIPFQSADNDNQILTRAQLSVRDSHTARGPSSTHTHIAHIDSRRSLNFQYWTGDNQPTTDLILIFWFLSSAVIAAVYNGNIS